MVGVNGSGSIMEYTACCEDRAAENDRFHCVTDAYRCLMTGSPPSQNTADVARVILSAVCAESSVELTCISLTVVEKMISSMTSHSQTRQVKFYCMEILTMLFQDKDLMSQLVSIRTSKSKTEL